MHRFRSLTLHALLVAVVATLTWPSLASAANDRYIARARLFGPTALKGNARYEERQKNGSLMRRFKVEVQNGVPGQTLAVQVNGDSVGSITVNVLGRGEFELRTPQHIDSPGDGLPMPANFPRLGTADNVSAGPIAGNMFITVSQGGGNPPPPNVQNTRLRGQFSGDGAASGKVEYRERFKNNLGLERRFKVEIEDAAPNTNYQVSVNGQPVVTVTTNGAGFVEFQYRTAAFIDSPDDGVPMPSTFPSLTEGDQVTVGSMSTTLSRSGGGGGGSGGSGGGGGGGGGGGDD